MYGAKTTPHMYVIDAEGKLVYKGAIDNDSWGKNKGKDLVNYVADLTAAIQLGKAFGAKTTLYFWTSSATVLLPTSDFNDLESGVGVGIDVC